MDLIAELSRKNRTIDQITKIYHGLENCCRCGCGGKYFKRGTRGFTRALNTIQKPKFKALAEGELMHTSYGVAICRGIDHGSNYLDIPYNANTDKCYCLYFD